MKPKLRVIIEKEVFENAKKYAKESGQSLSEMVENYFKMITFNRKDIKSNQLSPRVRRLRGIIKSSQEIGYKQTLTEELCKKYGN